MKLMILDGNSVINRAFYGVRPLTTRDGLYTNAIYGFLNILEKERSEEKPDALCVAFDLHAPTFRHLRYDGYKATRHPMPEELAMQMPVMKQVLAAMNIPVYACEGWEADDVLGTVGRLCEEAGWDCAILTGDRDSLQLVDEHVSVRLVRTQGGQTRTERYTPDVFRAEYGLEPKRLIDLKALMGDSSDNIPGVAGVGPKTANDLLQRFGTLDGVYANLSRENMKGKLFDKLENGRESAYLSYELATIRCDAPIDFTPENNLIRPPKRRALYDLFTTLEFQRLIDRYGLRSAALEQDESEEPAQPVTGTCTLLDVQTPEQAQPLLSGVTLSIAAADDLSMLVAAPHMDGPDQTAYVLRRETLGTDFVPLLQRLFAADVPKTVHDSKPLLRALLDRCASVSPVVRMPMFREVCTRPGMSALMTCTPLGWHTSRHTARRVDTASIGSMAVSAGSTVTSTSGSVTRYSSRRDCVMRRQTSAVTSALAEISACAPVGMALSFRPPQTSTSRSSVSSATEASTRPIS